MLLETLQPTLRKILAATPPITSERQAQLESIAATLRANPGDIDLTFICTHNSRRSHLAQIWAQTAAAHYGIACVRTHSGGTEATACNPRTVRALRRAGFSIVDTTGGENPRYLVQYSEEHPPLPIHSKIYDQDGNPTANYIAILTCNHADQNCPIVRGAAHRLPLPYIDPKVSDDTPAEDTTYDERSLQIARDMFHLLSLTRNTSTKTA